MKLSKGKLCLAITGIFILAFVSMYTFVYMPAIAKLYENYPDRIGAVNYFIAGSSICTLILMLLVPALQNVFGQKRLLLIGAAMIAAGGAVGLAYTDIAGYCIAITITMSGYGITGTMALSVLMEIISEKQIGLFNGLYQVVAAMAGAILAIIGGALTVRNWQSTITVTWILCAALGVLAFVLLAFSIPSELGQEVPAETAEEAEHGRKTPWNAIIPVFMAFLFLGTVYTYINSLFSIYLKENALGDASFAGTLQSLGTVGSCVMCFAFAFVYPKIGRKIILIPMAVITVCVLLLSLACSFDICVVSALLMGAAFGCAVTYFYTVCPTIAPYHTTTAVAAVGIALNLPYVIYSYVYTFLVRIFGTMTHSLLLMAAITGAELIVTAVYLKANKRTEV